MIVFLRGSDSYLALAAIGQIIDRYRREHPDNLELKDFSPTDRFNFADLGALPLLASHRLFVLRRVGLMAQTDQATLASYLADLPATTVALVWDEQPVTPVLARVLETGKIIAVSPLTGDRLNRWLKTTEDQLGVELTAVEARELINRFNNNLFGLKTELELLALDHPARPDPRAWQPSGQSGSFFSPVGSGDWQAVRRQLIDQWLSGVPSELIIGSLSAAVAVRPKAKGEERLWLTELLATADLAVKTGLLAPATMIGHLAGRLASRAPVTLQWQVLWDEIITG